MENKPRPSDRKLTPEEMGIPRFGPKGPDKEKDFAKMFNRDLSKKGTVDINDLDPNMYAITRMIYDKLPVLKGDIVGMLEWYFDKKGWDKRKIHKSLAWSALKEMSNPADKKLNRTFIEIRDEYPTHKEFEAFMDKLLDPDTTIKEI